MKRLVGAALALAVTLGALAYALWDVDFAAMGALFAAAEYWILAPFLAAIAVHYWLKAVRWALILHPLDRFTPTQVLPAMMIGFGANNVLPGHLGELLRAVVFSRQFSKPVSGVLVSQVLERIADVLCILAFYFVATASLPQTSRALEASTWATAGILLVACVAVAAAALRPDLLLMISRAVSRWLPAGPRHHADKIVDDVIVAVGAVRSVRTLVLVLANSIVQWAVIALAVWLSVRAIGVTISPAVSIIVLTFTVLAITVPSAPGYVGAIQAAFVFAMTPFGVSDEAAFAASVFFQVAQWVPVTAAGVLSFSMIGFRPSRLRGDVEKAKSGAPDPLH